uniref:Rho-related GTP-binding protein RhoU n=1 Tax=Ascaris lumbricoides TaxID=6252 RepID=A0A0M3I5B4_ASCLU
MVGVRIDPVEEEARVLKCVLVGDAAVGKTSLIVSYTTNGYPHDYVPTAFDNYSATRSEMVGVRIDPVEEEARVLKCVLVGDAAVGKTSLIVSYTTNGYPHDYVPTAFDNYSVVVRVDNQPIRLQLCDTAGQAEFDSLRPFSYPDTDVFLLCFNVMVPSTLRSITDHWLPEITRSSPNTPSMPFLNHFLVAFKFLHMYST